MLSVISALIPRRISGIRSCFTGIYYYRNKKSKLRITQITRINTIPDVMKEKIVWNIRFSTANLRPAPARLRPFQGRGPPTLCRHPAPARFQPAGALFLKLIRFHGLKTRGYDSFASCGGFAIGD